MKKQIILLFMFFVVNVFGLDYGKVANWVICDSKEATAEEEFDVFYIYSTLAYDKTKPLMDCSDPQQRKNTVEFTTFQTRMFEKKARVFAPYVRQAELTKCIDSFKNNVPWEKSNMQTGIEDTSKAFAYYMEHYNNGRPFILLGHSQGSMDLYCLLKNNLKISKKNGFVAAYLTGLPKITTKQFAIDFRGRDIGIGKCADDIGVVLVWNTQCKQCDFSLFSGPGVLCINPINWRIDGTPASAKENLGAKIYYELTGKTESFTHFCGAMVDPKKGALIVDFSEDSRFFQTNMMGKGISHSYDIFFFYENIRKNAIERVKKWKSRYHKIENKIIKKEADKENLVSTIAMPDWLKDIEESNLNKPMRGDEAKMRFVINLALENVRQKTGGPFGAAIFDIETDCLIAAGINCVVPANQSWAHAEMTAFARAQNKLKTYDLKRYLLVTSCEPCAMCYGATPWSGVKQLIYGANGDMARAVNFDEGDKIVDWVKSLEKRGISVRGPMCLDEAIKPFNLYKELSGIIY